MPRPQRHKVLKWTEIDRNKDVNTQPPPQGGQLLLLGPRGACSQQQAFKEILQK